MAGCERRAGRRERRVRLLEESIGVRAIEPVGEEHGARGLERAEGEGKPGGSERGQRLGDERGQLRLERARAGVVDDDRQHRGSRVAARSGGDGEALGQGRVARDQLLERPPQTFGDVELGRHELAKAGSLERAEHAPRGFGSSGRGAEGIHRRVLRAGFVGPTSPTLPRPLFILQGIGNGYGSRTRKSSSCSSVAPWSVSPWRSIWPTSSRNSPTGRKPWARARSSRPMSTASGRPEVEDHQAARSQESRAATAKSSA